MPIESFHGSLPSEAPKPVDIPAYVLARARLDLMDLVSRAFIGSVATRTEKGRKIAVYPTISPEDKDEIKLQAERNALQAIIDSKP